MRKPLIVANWKMNHTVEESLHFVSHLKQALPIFLEKEVVLCPPATALYSLSVALSEEDEDTDEKEYSKIKIGAQHCHWEENGAYTGEISPSFLKELGCQYTLVGHSERRHLFGETNEMVNKIVAALIMNKIIPILCIGEKDDERRTGKTMDVLKKQLSEGLKGLSREKLLHLVIAYEPVWAIGTGNTATTLQAQEAHLAIRNWIKDNMSSELSSKMRILYGGSVKPENIAKLMAEPDIDGALVGGASLTVDSFIKIVNYDRS